MQYGITFGFAVELHYTFVLNKPFSSVGVAAEMLMCPDLGFVGKI